MTIPINSLKPNPRNPRQIKDDRFDALCKSLAEFPQMMELRPIVIDADKTILGGNMRWRALKHNGLKELPDKWVKQADTLTEDERRRFIVMDNETFGEYDYDILSGEFELAELEAWGMDLPEDIAQPDFAPGTEEDQGKLDQLEPKWITCPFCQKEWDEREQNKSAN